MTLEQIIALSQAGFTKQEILSVANLTPQSTPQSTPQPTPQPTTTPIVAPLPGAPQAAHTPTTTPTPAPAQAQAQAQAHAQAQVQAQAQGTDSENGVLSKLNELEKLLLMGNVNGSQMPEQATADDMLAAIINPFENK